MRYYRSSFAIIDFFDNFLRLEKLAQFLIKTKLQNNKSNNEIILERANNALLLY